MANILASMTVALGSDTKQFVSGMKNAATHLTQFQNNADKLKGVDLSRMKADFSASITQISQLDRETRKLRSAIRYATDEKSVKALNEQLERTQTEIKRIQSLGKSGLSGVGSGANGAARGMDNLAGSAYMVNTEFARIIQDAPFGMMGIGNNIQQLTANFGELQKKAGGTGAAIKATLSAMITPASLLTLGIAAVTSAWILYEKWAQKSAKASKETANSMQTAEQAAEEYINTLEDLAKSRAQGEREAQKELVTLRMLYERTQDTSLSIKERVKAVDELQKQYPAYFKNLKDEDILAGNAAKAYEKLSKSILEYAQAQASLSLIEKKAQQIAVNKLRIKDLKEQQKQQAIAVKSAEELQAAQDQAAASAGSMYGSTGSITGAQKVYKLREAYDETAQSIKQLGAENKKLMADMELLAPGAAPALFEEDKDSTKKAKEKLTAMQELIKAYNQANKEAAVYGDYQEAAATKVKALETAINRLISEGISPQSAQIQELKRQMEGLNNIDLSGMTNTFENFANSGVTALDRINERLGRFKAKTVEVSTAGHDMVKRLSDSLVVGIDVAGYAANAIMDSVSLMGEHIGRALAGAENPFNGFFDGIMSIVADFMGSFGKALVSAGVAALAFEQLAMAPGAAIAAGLALIAASGVVKGVMSKGLKGGGGISAGGGTQLQPRVSSGVQGPREVVFKLQGRELIGLMESEQYYKGRVRGGR